MNSSALTIQNPSKYLERLKRLNKSPSPKKFKLNKTMCESRNSNGFEIKKHSFKNNNLKI